MFGLRQRDKSAKVIDYNDQGIRAREYLLLLGIPFPHGFSAEPAVKSHLQEFRFIRFSSFILKIGNNLALKFN